MKHRLYYVMQIHTYNLDINQIHHNLNKILYLLYKYYSININNILLLILNLLNILYINFNHIKNIQMDINNKYYLIKNNQINKFNMLILNLYKFNNY